MALKSLLLHLEADPNAKASKNLAILLGQELGLHITGLVLAVHPTIPTYAHHPMLIDTLLEMQQADLEQAKLLSKAFLTDIDRLGLSGECRTETCFMADCAKVIGLHSRYSDLIVINRPNAERPGTGGAHLTEEVVLSSGRPILVAPDDFAATSFGKRIAIAWNATREAARALNDAIPLLEAAEKVQLIIVDAKSRSVDAGQEPGADIARHLARHGCSVEVEPINSADGDVGQTLLKGAHDFDADLLVMGAYGHSRLREIVLGGVTQTVLEQAHLPVLMSH